MCEMPASSMSFSIREVVVKPEEREDEEGIDVVC